MPCSEQVENNVSSVKVTGSPSGAGSFTEGPFSASILASSCKLSRRSAARLKLICSSSSTCVYHGEVLAFLCNTLPMLASCHEMQHSCSASSMGNLLTTEQSSGLGDCNQLQEANRMSFRMCSTSVGLRHSLPRPRCVYLLKDMQDLAGPVWPMRLALPGNHLCLSEN